MRVVFMGTPQLAADVLSAVARTYDVVGVFTRPDAVRGRGKALVGSPVRQVAEQLDLPVFTPKSLKDAAVVDDIRALQPDVICVAAYGMILPKDVLGIPRFGCLNVHASLLPRWRGAAPIERAILAGDETTGVCIMRMEEGLDTGPYCLREELAIEGQSLLELSRQLAEMGGRLLVKAIGLVSDGEVIWTDQPDEGVMYAHKLEKGDLDGSERDTAREMDRKVRASSAAHPSKATIAGKKVTLEEVAIVCSEDDAQLTEGIAAGAVAFRAKRLFLGVADGVIEVVRVKPDGKKSMDARSFAAGIQGIKGNETTWGMA